MRVYTINFENVSVSAAQDFFEISPADDKPVKFIRLKLCNVGGTADAGDSQEEMLRLSVVRGHTTSGSGGSAPTPNPINSTIDAAAGFAAEMNNTTIAATSGTTIWADGWNVRVPYDYPFVPEERIGASQGNTTIVVRLLSTPADTLSVSGTLVVAEDC